MYWRACVLAGLAAAAACVFRSGDEAGIREQLQALKAEANATPTDEVASMARAARIGAFFTDDAVVELGTGSEPIVGRETIAGLAHRLQPRTAVFKLDVADVTVQLRPDGHGADVSLTVEFSRQRVDSGERSLDAREFALVMRKIDGVWRIARAAAVDTLIK